MAKKFHIIKTCDLKNVPGAPRCTPGRDVPIVTRTFTFGGDRYEIDLCPKHDNKFDSVIGEAARKGRKAGAGKRNHHRTERSRIRSAAIREWALAKYPTRVPKRGRIPQWIKDEYDRENLPERRTA